MSSLRIILFASLAIFNHVSHAQSHSFAHEQASLSSDFYNVRPAVKHDIDDIATVILDAFMPSDMWRYVMIDPAKYYHYTWHCLRDEIAHLYEFRPPHMYANVITVADNEHSNGRSERVVATGVWQEIYPGTAESLSTIGLTQLLAVNCGPDRLDINRTRAQDGDRQLQAVEDKYFNGLNETQMYLSLLATHPDWDGHGFGAMNVHWGMEYAAKHALPVTLLATPAGYPLYDSLGFESVANITIKELDNLGDLWFEVMRWDA